MTITELNHVALRVSDLHGSVAFYRGVLKLDALPRPAFSFPGAWFRLGTNQELHLIEGDVPASAGLSSRGNHFALRVSDVVAVAREFTEAGVVFNGPRRRPDGALQVFLEDPDGHVIELCGNLP